MSGCFIRIPFPVLAIASWHSAAAQPQQQPLQRQHHQERHDEDHPAGEFVKEPFDAGRRR